jgi:hypothetical protein
MMTVAKFNHNHPLAYQRLLMGSCALMLMCGLVSTLGVHSGSRHGFDELALPLPTPPQDAPAQRTQLAQLPGSDGTATVAAAPAATVAAVVPAASSSDDLRQVGRTLTDIQFGDSQWDALNALWTRESNWNPSAHNASGACGIPQALPCSKMTASTATGQIQWGLSYIQRRYGTPAAAWEHEQSFGWY